jgi:molecular chaperone GrpE (heat shock protein)
MTQNNQERLELLSRLVRVEGDITSLATALNRFEWDFEGTPFILTKEAVKNALSKFIQDLLTVDDMLLWAETLELREDVDYLDNEESTVSEVMHVLANPDLEGKMTKELSRKLLAKL